MPSTPKTTNRFRTTHHSDATFAYSLSPAATWKGLIGKGKIEINIVHPEPEDVSIEKPKERFRKISDTHYEWTFEDLKPTLADDIRIVAHSKYDKYPTGYSEEELSRHAAYVLKDHQYFLDHTDYDATASSTLAPQGNHNYDVVNIKDDPSREIQTSWAEGVEGDGIGESVTLNVKRPLPLYGILIRPGYYDYDNKDPWKKIIASPLSKLRSMMSIVSPRRFQTSGSSSPPDSRPRLRQASQQD
jgi:hypothetical protein